MVDETATMRIDRFLWFARLAPTRSTAQKMAEAAHVRIDGRVIDRAHAPVRVGSVLTLMHARQVRVVRVEALPWRRGSAMEALACLTDLAPAIDLRDRQS